jgi:predicted DNA-binding protein
MYVPGRKSTRHMKGNQVAMTLYLPPRKYWLLKWLSRRRGLSMQTLLRDAIDVVLEDAARLR